MFYGLIADMICNSSNLDAAHADFIAQEKCKAGGRNIVSFSVST